MPAVRGWRPDAAEGRQPPILAPPPGDPVAERRVALIMFGAPPGRPRGDSAGPTGGLWCCYVDVGPGHPTSPISARSMADADEVTCVPHVYLSVPTNQKNP